MSNTWGGTSQALSCKFLPNERVMQPLGYCPIHCSDNVYCDMLLLFAISSLLNFFGCRLWLAQNLLLLSSLYCMFLPFRCSFFNFLQLKFCSWLSRKDRWFILHCVYAESFQCFQGVTFHITCLLHSLSVGIICRYMMLAAESSWRLILLPVLLCWAFFKWLWNAH